MSQFLDFWRRGENPFRELTQLQSAVDRLFDQYADRPRAGVGGQVGSVSFVPACEVKETKDQYQFRFELPGIPKEQIKIEVDKNRLTVMGERKSERKEESQEGKNHLTEFSYGTFMRAFTLPAPVDPERVSATYDQGVLTVSLAKGESAQARQIAIK